MLEEKERRSAERSRREKERAKRKADGGLSYAAPRAKARKQPKGDASGAGAGAGAGVGGARAARRKQEAADEMVGHVHEFLPDEKYDEVTDMWTKRCACGFELMYERM